MKSVAKDITYKPHHRQQSDSRHTNTATNLGPCLAAIRYLKSLDATIAELVSPHEVGSWMWRASCESIMEYEDGWLVFAFERPNAFEFIKEKIGN